MTGPSRALSGLAPAWPGHGRSAPSSKHSLPRARGNGPHSMVTHTTPRVGGGVLPLGQAHRALLERPHRQRKANEARTARQNPIVRRILDETFDHLRVEDENGNIRSAIARHPLDHILAAAGSTSAMVHASSSPSSSSTTTSAITQGERPAIMDAVR